MDQTEFRSFYDDTKEFPDPSHGQFIEALTYDDAPDNPTSDPSKRVLMTPMGTTNVDRQRG